MRIALLGASSQIARDLTPLFIQNTDIELSRFVRDVDTDTAWREVARTVGVPVARPLEEFSTSERFDVIINFIGAGDPARAAVLGKRILDITRHYDDLVMGYLQRYSSCRYLFLSSGAAYGIGFEHPVTERTLAAFPINDLGAQHWYGLAKFQAECQHRIASDLTIIDIRIFSYISRSLDLGSRFLIADIARALLSKETVSTSPQDITRDYICPEDLFMLMQSIFSTLTANTAVDCYSQAPIGKIQMLDHLVRHFGLRYMLADAPVGINVTGIKPNYFSKNRKAAQFGYKPRFDSLTAITSVIGYIISQSRSNDV